MLSTELHREHQSVVYPVRRHAQVDPDRLGGGRVEHDGVRAGAAGAGAGASRRCKRRRSKCRCKRRHGERRRRHRAVRDAERQLLQIEPASA